MSVDVGPKPVEANLASLNEIVAEILAALVEHGIGDAEFRDMTRSILRDHSWALGYEFQGERNHEAGPTLQPAASAPSEAWLLMAVLVRKLGGKVPITDADLANANPHRLTYVHEPGGAWLELRP